MLPLEITRFLRSATVLSQCAAALLVCTACANDITCIDLANCVYPEADAGSSDTNASAQSPASGEPTSTTSDDGQESALTSPASHDTSASPSAATSNGDDGQPTSGDPSSNDATSNGATSSDPAIGNCLENGACECEEGTTGSCWETPDGAPITAHPEDAIGDCKLGKRTCEGGAWSACIGAIAPQEKDSCDRPLADDNCNGEVNEDCDCTPSDTRACGTDEGPCVAGVQTCGEDGKWEPECVGEVAPADEETCAVANTDANCNGQKNEGCECIGTEVEPCNDCGERACNPDTGRWGACRPVEGSHCSDDATGIEVCNSSGNWQTQACANDDETHCDVSCTSTSGEPQCEVTAKDADDDGYRAAACVNAVTPGNDCDDSTETTYPGAFEGCDGVDNDCDGYADILDSSVNLAGGPAAINKTPAVFDVRRVDMAWNGTEFFLLADARPAGVNTFTSIHSGYAHPNGAAGLYTGETLPAQPADPVFYDSPRIAYAGGTLGAYVRMDGRAYGARFVTIGSSGELLTSQRAEGWPLGDIVNAGSAFSLVTTYRSTATNDYNTFFLASTSLTGSAGASISRNDVAGDIEYVNAARSGTTTAIVFADVSQSEPSVNLIRSSGRSLEAPLQLAQPARNPDIAALSNGDFVIGWTEEGGFRVQARSTNGNVVCESNLVEFGDGVLDARDAVALAESSLGILAMVTDSGGTTGRAEVFVLDQSCQLRSQLPKPIFNPSALAYQGHIPHIPRIAVGGGYVAFGWTVEYLSQYAGYVRVVPEAMCN